MIGRVSDPADLGVRDAAAALSERSLSSRELVEACLARIRERDGTHSFDGDPGSDGPGGEIGRDLFRLVLKARVAGRDPEMELRAAARRYRDLVRAWERS